MPMRIWEALRRYTVDGRLTIDNDRAVVRATGYRTRFGCRPPQGRGSFHGQTCDFGGRKGWLPGKYDSAIALRDIKWLCAVCSDRKLSSQTARINRLCSTTVQRFCESYVQAGKPFHRREMPVGIKALPLLAKALVAIRADSLLAKTIDAVRSDPESFSLEKAQVPCLKTLIPWSTKREGVLNPLLERWLVEVSEELESITSEKPLPPTDWARPAKVECNCRFCVQLNEFLLDPATEETRIAAREDSRVHITHNIRQYRCDASHKLEKKGSPHSLVLTKTTASHDLALKQYATNVELLKSLPSLD